MDSSTEAGQSTWVSPKRARQDPSAYLLTSVSSTMLRSWSKARPEGRIRLPLRVGFGGKRSREQGGRPSSGAQASPCGPARPARGPRRSEEHTSELQSLMRISYAVFCLKKKTNKEKTNITNQLNTIG